MPEFTSFDFAVEDAVARITLNNPAKRNALGAAFWPEIREAFGQIELMPEVRAVVVASRGPHFTAGIDLALLGGFLNAEPGIEEARRRERLRRVVLDMQESFNVFERARAPVLAAVQGGCIGGGIDMITACDMRYCTQDAFFVIKEIVVGMTADLGTLQRLPRIIPEGLARELAYTGRTLSAREAKECGLVNAVLPDHEALLDHVIGIAKSIAGHSPLAVAGSKEMLNYRRDHSLEDSLNYMATWQAGMFLSDDLREAAQAAQAKREPVYGDLAPGSDLPE